MGFVDSFVKGFSSDSSSSDTSNVNIFDGSQDQTASTVPSAQSPTSPQMNQSPPQAQQPKEEPQAINTYPEPVVKQEVPRVVSPQTKPAINTGSSNYLAASATESLNMLEKILESLPSPLTIEALVAILNHREDFLEAVKNGTLDQLLENIRKYNPLIAVYNEKKSL